MERALIFLCEIGGAGIAISFPNFRAIGTIFIIVGAIPLARVGWVYLKSKSISFGVVAIGGVSLAIFLAGMAAWKLLPSPGGRAELPASDSGPPVLPIAATGVATEGNAVLLNGRKRDPKAGQPETGGATLTNNAVPSCYEAISVSVIPAPPTRETFVFIDQATPIDLTMRSSLRESLAALVTEGTAFTIASFSGSEAGKFPIIIGSGVIEPPVPPQYRNNIPVKQLAELDNCLMKQSAYGTQEASKGLSTAIEGAGDGFAPSEVLWSLKQLSARVAASPSTDRVVLLVSSMWDRSITKISLFGEIRTPDPDAALIGVTKRDQIGDFRGARVYIVGAGLSPRGHEPSFAEMTALEAFWRKWFAVSNARVAEFGAPNLLTPIPPK